MSQYTTVDGYKFDAQINYGWGLTLNMTGKAPEVSKRIFDTYEHMMYYVNDYNDSCIEGLTLTVMADGENNGVYFVDKIGTEGENKAFANDGHVVKLGGADAATEGIAGVQSALDAEIAARKAVDGQNGQTYVANENTNYISEATSLNDADIKLDSAIKVNADAIAVLNGGVDVEGSVAKSVADAVADVKSEIEGELGDDDAKTLASLNDRIDSAIADAATAAKAATTKVAIKEGEQHLEIVETEGVDKEKIFTLNTIDVASASALSDEISARTDADKALSDRLDIIEGEDDVEGSIANAVADAKSELLGGAAEEYNTLGKLEDKIIAAENAAKAAATIVEKDASAINLTLSVATNETTGAKTYTIGQSDIASAAALDAEVSARTDADNALSERITSNADAITVLNGGVDVNGSVAKAVNDAKSELLGDAEKYNTLGKLEDKIDEAIADAKSYSIVAITEGLSANVKEAFKLVDEDGTQAGATIQIYKDSALQSAVLGTATVNGLEQDCLILTYLDVNGSEQVVNIPLGDFLRESEFKNGLQVNNGEVSVKLGEGNESFLTVGADGVKLSGVQDAINAAKSSILGNLDETDAKTLESINDELNGLDGKVAALENDKSFVKELTVNDVDATIANNKATVTIDGSDIKLSSDYVLGDYSEVAAADLTPVTVESSIDAAISTIEGNIVKLTKEVIANEEVCAAAITKLNEQLGFNENAEFVPCDSSQYINAATSISHALCILDSSLKNVSDAASSNLSAAVEALDSTVTSENGKLVNITVVEKDGILTSASVDETNLSEKISEIEEAIETASAAATTEVVEGTTNPMLSVTKDETAADGHVKYIIDLADSWDCGTFEYTEQ